MLPTKMRRIPKSLEEAVEDLRKEMKKRNGIDMSFVKTADLYVKYNRDTVFRVTKKIRL